MSTNPHHLPQSSDELDIFAAAKYLSGSTNIIYGHQPIHMRSQGKSSSERGEQRRHSDVLIQEIIHVDTRSIKDKKKLRQPSSPSARLARFFTSLFHKEGKAKIMNHASQVENVKEGGFSRNTHKKMIKRRNSISGSNDIYSNTMLGTPTRRYRPQDIINSKEELVCYGKVGDGHSTTNGILEKGGRVYVREILEKDANVEKMWTLNKNNGSGVDRERLGIGMRKKGSWRREELEEDGGGSDSSSDLFELPSL